MDQTRAGRGATGWLLFAAAMIFIAGFHNIVYGAAALNDYQYLVTNTGTGDINIIYQDLDFWGALLLALGCLQVVAAFGILSRNQWARWFAVATAALNIIAQLSFLALFPLWSIVLIALDVLVIWALTTYDAPRRAWYEPYPETEQAVGLGERREYAGTRRGTEMPPPPSTTDR